MGVIRFKTPLQALGLLNNSYFASRVHFGLQKSCSFSVSADVTEYTRKSFDMSRSGPVALTSRIVTLPLTLLRHAVTEPLVTAALLAALTKAPLQYRSRLLRVLGDAGLSPERVALLIKSLKYLLVVGVARRLNQSLNRLALNHWNFFGKPGAPFNWSAVNKTEIIVVTGGCSGFGYEMVKGFSKHAKVILLDVSPVPEELKRRKYFSWTGPEYTRLTHVQ